MVRAALLSALAIVGSSAWAQNSYMGLAGGVSSWDLNCTGTSSCDTRGASLKLFGGYHFNQNFGLEGSVFSLGRPSASAFGGTLKAEFKASGFELAGVARAPFNDKWSGFAKLGVASIKATTIASIPSLGLSDSASNSSVQPTLGLGVTYKLGNGLQARAEWETRKVEVVGNEKVSVGNFSAGIQYSF